MVGIRRPWSPGGWATSSASPFLGVATEGRERNLLSRRHLAVRPSTQGLSCLGCGGQGPQQTFPMGTNEYNAMRRASYRPFTPMRPRVASAQRAEKKSTTLLCHFGRYWPYLICGSKKWHLEFLKRASKNECRAIRVRWIFEKSITYWFCDESQNSHENINLLLMVC